MPRNYRQGVRRNRRTNNNDQKEMADLKELVLMQKQQIRFGMPNEPDVEFPVISRHKVYTFVVGYQVGTISGSSTVPAAGAYAFMLSQFPSSGLFTQLFDRYRLMAVNLQFQPISGGLPATTGGPLVTAIDYDDTNVPNGELQQRDTAMQTPNGVYFERTLTPRIAAAAYSGAFSSYGNLPATTWIDTASGNVQYYGIKYYLPIQSGNSQLYAVTARVMVQFKNNF
jgi:hypothetical protein